MVVFFITILFLWVLVLQGNLNDLKFKVKKLCRTIESLKAETNQSENPVGTSYSSEEDISEDFSTLFGNNSDISESSTKEEVKQNISIPKIEIKKSDFEKLFLGNIFNKIGAVALIVAFIIFLKLANIKITETMQILIALFSGLGCIFGAYKLHEKEFKNYAEVLMGLGFGVLFVTIYCATTLYGLMPYPLSAACGALLVLATFFIAEKFKTFSTIAIGMVAGYLNPFFLCSDVNVEYLFFYLIVMNLISLVYVYRNSDKIALNFVNLVLTTLTIFIYSLFNKETILIVYPLALWILYLINDVISLEKNKSFKLPEAYLSALNYFIFLFFAVLVYVNADFEKIGIITLFAGMMYTYLAFSKKSKDFAYGILFSLLFATYYLVQNPTLKVAFWSLEVLGITYVSKRYQWKFLHNWVYAFVLAVLVGICCTRFGIWDVVYKEIPMFYLRGCLFAVPIGAIWGCSRILKTENSSLSNVLQWVYITIAYLFAFSEVEYLSNRYVDYSSKYLVFENVKFMLNVTLGFLYTIQTRKIFNAVGLELFRISSYFMYFLSMLGLLIASCLYVDSTVYIPIFNARFMAFMFAIAANMYYAKHTKSVMYSYLSILLGLIIFSIEVVCLCSTNYNFDNPIVLSLAWLIYSAILITVGILKDVKELKLSGIWITILALLKILLFDMSDVEALYRTIAFFVAGLILMGVSYLYTKKKV